MGLESRPITLNSMKEGPGQNAHLHGDKLSTLSAGMTGVLPKGLPGRRGAREAFAAAAVQIPFYLGNNKTLRALSVAYETAARKSSTILAARPSTPSCNRATGGIIMAWKINLCCR